MHACLFGTMLSAALLGSTTAPEEQPAPARFIENQVLIQTAAALPPLVDAYDDDLASTGDADLDQVLAREGVVSMRRVVRRPPRGWRDPSDW